MKALVTGGAGLIGSHIVDLLLQKGHSVKILDNLELPTHRNGKPGYLPKEAEFIHGDMRNESDLKKALKNTEVVFHNAATGGFRPDISRYFDSNTLGTAKMLELIDREKIPIHKIIVASSVAIYGEGKYICKGHGVIYPEVRAAGQLERKQWEHKCPDCGEVLKAALTDENKNISPQKPYSISKYDQEQMVLNFGRDVGIPVVALRYFVTYGPRQSLFNPYTGVISIFSTRILNNLAPVIYEDGSQTRDFIFVKDIARANLLVAEKNEADYKVFNVGTGRSVSIMDLVKTLIKRYGKTISPDIPGKFRPGEVRHIVADTNRISALGFKPVYALEEGLKEYMDWISGFKDIRDYFSEAEDLLKKAGVVRSARE